jgi:hypothetical protein
VSCIVTRALAYIVAAVVLAGVVDAGATDVPVTARRLVIFSDAGNPTLSSIRFRSRDRLEGITKGVGTDLGAIAARFYVGYDLGGSVGSSAAFSMPTGAFDGTAGWQINDEGRAFYRNRSAPDGPTTVREATVRNRRAKRRAILRLEARALGDGVILDLIDGGPPSGSVFTTYCVDNAGETFCHCTEFQNCSYNAFAGPKGPRARLKCSAPGIGDTTCRGFPRAFTASTQLTVDFDLCEALP